MFINAKNLLLGSLSLALLTNPANPSPAPAPYPDPDPSKANNPGVKWRLHLYQNTRCSGVDTFYSGSGSRKCENEILNGGALGYISETHEPPCEVVLFADDKCKRAVVTIAAGSHSHSSTKCQAPTVEGEKVEIRSFEVRC
ncbi:hypothetical protein CNMCM5793_008018 [Aspergillus hiratsukae]|uniref:Uncharacterized protein n=1 Tax=Aspergillus hiratsukae TaxID=1194566 RepID=A0A8H6UP37_9EURO|nr:hypothetical protein CNMCM5793_008018 [Aspergillus hiratsukae]KAF7158969.1 hypothetical protein CNMCM6106_005923 [Aspergillus hiratsukae]